MKVILFDGWEVLLAAITIAFVVIGAYERGRRKGLEDAEHLFNPVIALMEKWARLCLKAEQAVPPQEGSDD